MRKVFFIGVLLTLCYQGLLSYPWNNNTREHLFGTVEECEKEDCDNYHVWLHYDSSKCEDPDCHLSHTVYHVDASIQDEGFRWRNSLDFTINGKNISEWKFNPVVKLDERAKDFVLSHTYKTIDGADKIHQHLSNIACNIKKVNPKIANVATAAITIVTEEEGKYKAYSTMVYQNNKVLAAFSDIQTKISDIPLIRSITNMYTYPFPVRFSPNLSYRYKCTEGKMGAYLFHTYNYTMPFIKILDKIILDNTINQLHIKFIVLHIHTTMDPCAVCTRYLVAWSQEFNNTEHALKSYCSKFLVEVSSDEYYTPRKTSNDAFSYYIPPCSHTECSGRDRKLASVVNIRPSSSTITTQSLAIPYGLDSRENWNIQKSFPPYIILGRVCSTGIKIPPCCAQCNHFDTCKKELNDVD